MIKKIFFYILIIVGVFMLGWIGHSLYFEFSNMRTLDGVRFEYTSNWNDARNYAKSLDTSGDWVCVNVLGMSFGEAEKTCNHECMHVAFSEIIAEECEKDFTKCSKLLDNWGNVTK